MIKKFGFSFFFPVLIILLSDNSFSESSSYKTLPEIEIFDVLIADPRESIFSMRREKYKTEDESYSAAVVSFGDYLPVLEFDGGGDGESYQLQIDGSLFALFNLDTSSYNLINTDYFFGLSLAHSDGKNFSYRLRLYHASSHLGDEFIIDNPDINRENSSYESLEYILSYKIDGLRLYGGGSYIVRANSEIKEKPTNVKLGFEYYYPVIFFKQEELIFASNFHMQERSDWRGSISILLGASIAKSNTKEIRLMANYYSGNSVQGQFYEEKLRYYGLGLYFIV